MRDFRSGFTLIELMIVVAIMGILASLAISSFQTYTIRTQVSEAISMAASAKTPIIDAFNQTGRPPADRAAAGMTPAASDTQGSFVAGVEIVNGRVDVLFGKDAHSQINGKILSLTPYMSDTGSFLWRCGAAPAPADTTVLSGGGLEAEHRDPDVPSRYLPKSCKP